MAVKVMMYVNEVAATASGTGKVRMNAVAKGPYAEWSQYTPAATYEITTLNPDATEWFRERLGKDVEITIDDPAPDQ